MSNYAKKVESYCALNRSNLYLTPTELADVVEKLEGLDAINDADMDKAHIGKVVELLDMYEGNMVSFELVLPEHNDPTQGRLSILSPIGSAILGRTAGEIVRVSLLGSRQSYLICKVSVCSPSAAALPS